MSNIQVNYDHLVIQLGPKIVMLYVVLCDRKNRVPNKEHLYTVYDISSSAFICTFPTLHVF